MTAPNPPNLFDPPPSFTLPVTRGADIQLELIYQVNSGSDEAPVYTPDDWPSGSTLKLAIDAGDPIEADATMDGPNAVVNIDYLQADRVLDRAPFRVVLSHMGGYDEVILHGLVKRFDQ